MAELVQIEWSPERPLFFHVYFDDATADQRLGGREAAEAMALSMGFESTPSDDESIWWKRPGSRDWTSVLDSYRPGPEQR
jgi:hypothetical protein